MHGITMIFLVVMPMSAAFFNYLIPLMIGARDVAFPRLNAFSFWVFLLGGLFLNSSSVPRRRARRRLVRLRAELHDRPVDRHELLRDRPADHRHRVARRRGQLAVTVINMRAPGMTLLRMPVFVWMGLVVQFLLVFSLPIITVALFELLFDRLFGTNFFDPTRAATRSSGSTCSGSSATPRSTS